MLTLALGLAGAPAALAAGPGDAGPGGLWAALQSWTQEILSGWLGWGETDRDGTQSPEAIYEASDCPEGDPECDGLEPTGGVPGDGSTTDEGPGADPNG